MLCQKNPPIKNSHVWPKFAVKWLKENCSGYLRRGDIPNKRLQDVTKFPILCLSCEGKFSTFETVFCEKIFKPFHLDSKNKIKQFEYGRWLSHFAISLSWRMVAIGFEEYSTRAPSQIQATYDAFEHWRKYLLGEINSIRPYRHHIFFFDFVSPRSSGISSIPDNFHTYIHSSFDGDLCFNEKGIVFVLLPGMAFWSPITPNDEGGFERGSAIAVRGKFRIAQIVSDPRFGQILHESATKAKDQTLSPRQQELVNSAYDDMIRITNPDEVAKIMKPINYDRELTKVKNMIRVDE